MRQQQESLHHPKSSLNINSEEVTAQIFTAVLGSTAPLLLLLLFPVKYVFSEIKNLSISVKRLTALVQYCFLKGSSTFMV